MTVLLEEIIIFLNIHCLGRTQGGRDKSGPGLVLNINGHFTSIVRVKYGASGGWSELEAQEIGGSFTDRPSFQSSGWIF